MSGRSHTCPRCQQSMEVGLLLDKGDHNHLTTAEWLEGPPARSFWTGLKTSDRKRLPVSSFRCTRCGYLESYAGGD